MPRNDTTLHMNVFVELELGVCFVCEACCFHVPVLPRERLRWVSRKGCTPGNLVTGGCSRPALRGRKVVSCMGVLPENIKACFER